MIHPIMGRGLSSNIYIVEDERIAIIDAGTHENSEYNINRIKEALHGRYLTSGGNAHIRASLRSLEHY